MKVCVVGLGTIGIPVLKYLRTYRKRLNIQVYGYDIVKRRLGGVKIYQEWTDVPKCDVYIITTPSAIIENACEKIESKDVLLTIESTSPVGTSRKLAEKYDFKYIIHCPHRYFEGDIKKHGVRQLRVIGAIDGESLEMGIKFYSMLNIPLHICSSIELAEMTKISENAYRFVDIAFAEELRMIAEENNVSFDELRKACNTKWNIEIKEARKGIGKICLPQDIRFLKKAAKNTKTLLLDSAIKTDEQYKERMDKK